MTDPPHWFYVTSAGSGSVANVYRLRKADKWLIKPTDVIEINFRQRGDALRLVEFVRKHRLKDEAPLFDILRDLFPSHREALDRVEMEVLAKQILDAGKGGDECE
ncbi:MAG: hypothetical protein L0Z62_36490 [Gemmataceae bacterium]|nr:hypothetical protein [Gemmataceae bacterium]